MLYKRAIGIMGPVNSIIAVNQDNTEHLQVWT